MSTDDRIAALERTVSAMQHRIAKLEAAPKILPIVKSAPVIEGAQIFHPAASTSFVMPTDAELVNLLDIVRHNMTPLFAANTDTNKERDFVARFRSAFRGLSSMPRTADNSLSLKLDKSVFVDRCEDILRKLTIWPHDIGLGAFTAALLAHGDVAHSINPARWPYDVSFSLGNHVGRLPDGSAWRLLLQTGKVLPATALPKVSQQPPPSPARVLSGAALPAWARD